MNYLADLGWECHFLKHTGPTQTLMPGVKMEDNEEFKFYVHGSALKQYCEDILQQRIRDLKPDIFGILLDTFMLNPPGNPWFYNLDFAPAKSIMYFPSDGGGGLTTNEKLVSGIGCNLPITCENILKKVDKPVAMARFSKVQAKEVHGINSEYIPHAIEPEIYKPLSEQEKRELRIKWSNKLQVDLRDRFIIGTVARNQGRKMLDRTFLMMKNVAKEIPEAILLAHTDKYDPATYFNPDFLMMQHGIQNKIVFTGTKYYKGFDYKTMNEIYNLFDLFYLGTSGEGFGIPIIEAMACEIPVLATDYTTTWELVERTKSGEAVKKEGEILGSWNVGRAVVDIEDSARKVIKLYKDPKLRKEYGTNGREAVLREYTWEIVSKTWDKLLRSLL